MAAKLSKVRSGCRLSQALESLLNRIFRSCTFDQVWKQTKEQPDGLFKKKYLRIIKITKKTYMLASQLQYIFWDQTFRFFRVKINVGQIKFSQQYKYRRSVFFMLKLWSESQNLRRCGVYIISSNQYNTTVPGWPLIAAFIFHAWGKKERKTERPQLWRSQRPITHTYLLGCRLNLEKQKWGFGISTRPIVLQFK